MDFLSHLQAIAAITVLLILYRLRTNKSNTNTDTKCAKRTAPEPPGAWPIFGHLPLLAGRTPIARTLGALADKLGPVYALRLGARPAVVVSSWEAVKDCFTTNDRIFATRPNLAIGRYVGYDRAAFALAPHGPYWRDVRKMTTVELLSNSRLEALKHVRTSTVNSYIKYLHELCVRGGDGSTAVMDKWFEHLAISINIRTVAGKRFSMESYGESGGEAWRLKRVLRDMLFLGGVFVVSDAIPCLEWMDLQGYLGRMKRAAKEINALLAKWLEEHVEKKAAAEGEGGGEGDFMDVMLSNLAEDGAMSSSNRDTIVKATALTLILTGTESTSLTLTWALSLLLNNPDALKKAQDEIEAHVGRNRWAQESDIKDLAYLQAIVKEALRLNPPGPVSGPREATEDCYVGGYYVPKGTRLIVNLWKLHRDPRVWADPGEFRPERFLTQHQDVGFRGQNFEFIPFSSGRRSCPAITYALNVAHLTLARFLQGFDMAAPGGAPVDMREGLGISLPKVNPLEVVLKPRLPSELYQML